MIAVASRIKLMRRHPASPFAWRACWLALVAGCLTIGVATSPAARGVKAARSNGAGRPWTIADLVEVKRITGVAVQADGRVGAVVVENPSIATGEKVYTLYEIAPGTPPRKLLEAPYIADVSSRPKVGGWTVRADLGRGVQLYSLGPRGAAPLVMNPDVAMLGASDGLIRDPQERLRPTGVISYQWSPDGTRLWYSRVRLAGAADRAATLDQGIVYDDTVMSGAEASDLERAATYRGVELHVLDISSGHDRLLATAPVDPQNFDTFRAAWGSTAWAGPEAIQYRLRQMASGALSYSLWRVNLADGARRQLMSIPADEIYYSAPTAAGLLAVRGTDADRRLVELSLDGAVLHDFGPAPFRRLGGGLGLWRNPAGDAFVSGVSYPDHEGLAGMSKDVKWAARLAAPSENLEPCAFNADLSFGLCARESLTRAPELVSIAGPQARVEVVFRPNAAYDAIADLRTVPATWTNRYGAKNTGYVTYPRDYLKGDPRPVIVVTHGADAQNKFAAEGFQWEFPVQVFAERGYFVLSVNEPKQISTPPYMAGASATSVERLQFSEGLNAVASMEAAVEDLGRRESIDRSRIGIAGYSRGAEITSLTISQSKVFAAASIGDDCWWSAGSFWMGSAMSRQMYHNLFGGSPFDPAAYPNYLKFSVSARAGQVAGPVLQQFTGYFAHAALELDQLLRDKAVPTELVAYADEAHLFYDPRHRASAMVRNLDWFDYWLRGVKDPDPAKRQQYARWDAMAAAWSARGGAAPRP